MLCQPLKFRESFARCEQSLFAHSHQDAYRRRKRYTEQLARVDPILVIDALDASFLRKGQHDRLRFTPAKAKVFLHFPNELPILNCDDSDSRFI